jgi:hypothetical protein
LAEEFSIIANPSICRVARQDGLPAGFAIVEFTEASLAEEAWIELEGLDIDGHKIHIHFCVPGETVAEAFSRYLFNSNEKNPRVRKQVLEKLEKDLSKSSNNNSNPNNSVCSPPELNSKLLKLFDEKYPAVLASFRRLLHRLQQHHRHQQQQLLSDQPGLLGEVPSMSELHLAQFETQLALLAVHLASQVQQYLPMMTTASFMQVLPPGSDLIMMSNKPSVAQATLLIQRMISDSSFELVEDNADVIKPFNRLLKPGPSTLGTKNTDVVDADDDEIPLRTDEIPSLMTIMDLMDDTSRVLQDVNSLLSNLEGALRVKSDKDRLDQLKNVESNAGASAGEEKWKVEKENGGKGLADDVSSRPGLLGAPPPVLVSLAALCRRPVFTPCTVLATYIESIISEAVYQIDDDIVVPMEARLPLSAMNGRVVSLFDLPLIKKMLINKATVENPPSQGTATSPNPPIVKYPFSHNPPSVRPSQNPPTVRHHFEQNQCTFSQNPPSVRPSQNPPTVRHPFTQNLRTSFQNPPNMRPASIPWGGDRGQVASQQVVGCEWPVSSAPGASNQLTGAIERFGRPTGHGTPWSVGKKVSQGEICSKDKGSVWDGYGNRVSSENQVKSATRGHGETLKIKAAKHKLPLNDPQYQHSAMMPPPVKASPMWSSTATSSWQPPASQWSDDQYYDGGSGGYEIGQVDDGRSQHYVGYVNNNAMYSAYGGVTVGAGVQPPTSQYSVCNQQPMPTNSSSAAAAMSCYQQQQPWLNYGPFGPTE